MKHNSPSYHIMSSVLALKNLLRLLDIVVFCFSSFQLLLCNLFWALFWSASFLCTTSEGICVNWSFLCVRSLDHVESRRTSTSSIGIYVMRLLERLKVVRWWRTWHIGCTYIFTPSNSCLINLSTFVTEDSVGLKYNTHAWLFNPPHAC